MTTEEQWRTVPGVDGYEASDQGRVRSLRRRTPRVLVATVGPCGFRTVSLTINGRRRCRRVGTLVALAWLGPRPPAAEVRRVNGNTLDDRPENLAYGTADEVVADHAARARREEAAGSPTHCPSGHRYTNVWIGAWGERFCRECHSTNVQASPRRAEIKRRSWARRRAQEVRSIPEELDGAETVRYGACNDCRRELVRTGPGPMPLRCPECRRQAAAQADVRYRARRGTLKPATSPCVDCDTPVNQRPGPGRAFLRCESCARIESQRIQHQANRRRRLLRAGTSKAS